MAREAYSHELTSVGFWPGNRDAPEPIFYAYAYPTPEGFADAVVAPDAAFWLDAMGEFALPHAALTSAPDPDAGPEHRHRCCGLSDDRVYRRPHRYGHHR